MAWFLAFKNVAQSILQSKTVTAGTSASTVTPDAGYDGLSDVTVNPTPSQTKTKTAGTSSSSVTPDTGYLLSKVTVKPTPSETKTATPSTTSQDITPTSGKLLSKVTVEAIQTQTKTETAGTSAKDVTPDSGYYLTKVTVNPTPSQTKSTTSSRSAQTITPDSGKLLSSVSIAKYPNATGTFTPTSSEYNSTAVDMGATNNLRYVNTAVCYAAGLAAGGISVKRVFEINGTYTYNIGFTDVYLQETNVGYYFTKNSNEKYVIHYGSYQAWPDVERYSIIWDGSNLDTLPSGAIELHKVCLAVGGGGQTICIYDISNVSAGTRIYVGEIIGICVTF